MRAVSLGGQPPAPRRGIAVSPLQEFHVGERFPLRGFRPHSVPQAYPLKWKKNEGGTHHAKLGKNRRCVELYRGDSNWLHRCRSGARRLLLPALPRLPLVTALSPLLRILWS